MRVVFYDGEGRATELTPLGWEVDAPDYARVSGDCVIEWPMVQGAPSAWTAESGA